MSSLGFSQNFQSLIDKAVSDKKITTQEAKNIQENLLKEVENGNITPSEAQDFVSSKFTGTNATIKLTAKSEHETNIFNFKIEGKESADPKIKVKDFEQKAVSDGRAGNDFQFKALYESNGKDNEPTPQNFITYDKNTGKITGAQLVKPGETRRGEDGKLITSKAKSPLPAEVTDMKGLIINDFKAYANPSLTQVFPNNETGLKDFLNSLKNIPGNQSNKYLTESNAKDLLNYIHTGQSTSGKVNVKQLQQLLGNLTGPEGLVIHDKNTPVQGDDKYGYSTTLQVRSLGALLTPENFSIEGNINKQMSYSNVFVLKDMSSSTNNMRKEQTANIKDKVANNPDFKGIVPKEEEFGFEKDSKFGSMTESAVVASTKILDREISKMKPGEKALITSFVDTNDSTTFEEFNNIKQKIDDAKKNGIVIDVKFTFGNVELDINDIKPEHFKDISAKPGANERYNLKWADIALPEFKKMPLNELLKSVSLIETSSSMGPELKNLIKEKLSDLSIKELNTLKTSNPGFKINTQVVKLIDEEITLKRRGN